MNVFDRMRRADAASRLIIEKDNATSKEEKERIQKKIDGMYDAPPGFSLLIVIGVIALFVIGAMSS
ncbi:MAG: hypothetical protein KAJ29_07145 [Alphaproteobacteria bacterium]|nr:hypothetical protein [Alphaproteobacteria bacterium]